MATTFVRQIPAVVGQVFEGDRRFDVVVRLPEAIRSDGDGLGRLRVRLPATGDGTRGFVPPQNLGSFITEVRQSVGAEVESPTGSWVIYGGAFEPLISAAKRLPSVVPAALLLIFGLLFALFRSVKHAAIVSPASPWP